MNKNKKDRYDWPVIETEYITSTSSLENLCEKFGCSLNAIRPHCKKGEWVKKRIDYRSELVLKSAREHLKKDSKKMLGELETTQILSDQIQNLIMNPEALFTHTYKSGEKNFMEKRMDTINIKTLNGIVNALDTIVGMKSEMLRVLSESDKQRMELEKARFEHQKWMDEQRIEIERLRLQQNGDDLEEDEYGVVEIPSRLPHDE